MTRGINKLHYVIPESGKKGAIPVRTLDEAQEITSKVYCGQLSGASISHYSEYQGDSCITHRLVDGQLTRT